MYIPKRNEARYQKILDEIERDRALKHNDEFLVDTILPSGEFHIIAGPSGVGKTTWFLPLLKDWSEGKPVLGFKSNPYPYVYISCDRSLKALDRTMHRIGLGDWRIHAYAIEDLDKYLKRYKIENAYLDDDGKERVKQLGYEDIQLENLPFLFNEIMQLDIKLFVVEAYGWFMEGGGGNGKSMYRDTMRLGSKVRAAYEKFGSSLAVTTHVPKMKKGEGYSNPRERIIGSVGQAAVASTIILLEQENDADVNDPNRIVTICPRDSKAMVLNYELDETGRYVLSENQGDASDRKSLSILDTKLQREQIDVMIATGTIEDWANQAKMSESSMFRWLKKMVAEGKLVKCGRAIYKKPRESDLVQ